MTDQLAVSVSLAQKINLGNYESADVFLSVSGVTAETTTEEIEAALDAGRLAWDALKPRLAQKINEVKNDPAREAGRMDSHAQRRFR